MDIIVTKANGKVEFEKDLNFLLSTLPNGTYNLSIKKYSKPRSINQNSLMWMWFKCLEDTTGQPKEDWHDYYCAKFLKRVFQPKSGKAYYIIGGTSKLTTVELAEFMNKVQSDAASEFGVILPLPDDKYFNQFTLLYK